MTELAANAPKITLHWLEKSRSQRIVWLLEELGVPYEIKTYKRDAKTMRAPPELKTIHALGKSPVITVGKRTIAESGLIVEYLCEHFAGPSSQLIPPKWQPGLEGQVGGETEAFMRYCYYMHYCEGSLMTVITLAFVPWSIKKAPTPFFLRPITSRIAAQMNASFVAPSFATHLSFLEAQLASAPEGGPYLCGAHLTGADILMSFPLIVAQSAQQGGLPASWAYTEMLKGSAGSQRAEEKIIAIDGEYNPNLL
ncbi:putative glutathione S-transferase [Mycena rosella]|uniref:glutathione transferase n=1 Tax=Mycena rosella TaxID=1033263 RepID=A0AAD7G0Q8_MYCRO|nr:putative glutathione S-transferase [Mycena rosella]